VKSNYSDDYLSIADVASHDVVEESEMSLETGGKGSADPEKQSFERESAGSSHHSSSSDTKGGCSGGSGSPTNGAAATANGKAASSTPAGVEVNPYKPPSVSRSLSSGRSIGRSSGRSSGRSRSSRLSQSSSSNRVRNTRGRGGSGQEDHDMLSNMASTGSTAPAVAITDQAGSPASKFPPSNSNTESPPKFPSSSSGDLKSRANTASTIHSYRESPSSIEEVPHHPSSVSAAPSSVSLSQHTHTPTPGSNRKSS
jgi:hypothetical protein